MKSIDVRFRELGTDQITTEQVAVNNSGDGLFMIDRGAYRQLAGNGQFHAKDPRSMMRKLRAMYEDQVVGMVRGSAWGWE